MLLFEKVKSFLTPKKIENPSSKVPNDNIIANLGDDARKIYGTFFDNNYESMFNLYGQVVSKADAVQKQAEKIKMYRNTAMEIDVSKAIDEIVNEIIFTFDDSDPLKCVFNDANEQISKKVQESFNKITTMMKLKSSLFELVKKSFIDGQIILHCTYNTENIKSGIQDIKMIEPCYFFYDKEKECFRYSKSPFQNNIYTPEPLNEKLEYSIEEIVRGDFGLYQDFINLSYIEPAIKPANQLRLLEDLLIPLRFSRSISRRVFNIDIGDLPTKRGEEILKEVVNKFKYKKFYNTETGEITNQGHVTSMVEDYFFGNKSGGRGTTVDVLDETGNLGEVNDILYFLKKVYRAMNIPLSRIDIFKFSSSTAFLKYLSTDCLEIEVKLLLTLFPCPTNKNGLSFDTLLFSLISNALLKAWRVLSFNFTPFLFFVFLSILQYSPLSI